MPSRPTISKIELLRETMLGLVRRAGPDLSSRQLAVFLICYLDDNLQTVRGLAATLNVSKPAITRALDRLGELGLARRQIDRADRRSVLVRRTDAGEQLLRSIAMLMADAAKGQKPMEQPGQCEVHSDA
jgi:DNA-binding MarR family transcriptional regulator